MNSWPPIDDERTLRRLRMSDSEFAALAERLALRIGGEKFTDQHLRRAITYPWHVPHADEDFLLVDGAIRRASDDETTMALGDAARHPLLAIGSNADPATLLAKLESLPTPEDRTLLGIRGSLADHAIGHSPHLAIYGSLPATIFRDLGAQTPATLLLVTTNQFTALSSTEFNYLLARLPADRWTGPVEVTDPILAYVSRHGVVTAETGEPIPLQRPQQRELLDRAATVTIGSAADALELVRRTIESYAWAVREARPRLAKIARPLDRSEWDLHPGD